MSHAFSRLADIRVSPGLSIDEIRKVKSQLELNNLTEYATKDGKQYKYILPDFPIAMAIAKDITIKVKTNRIDSESAKTVVENSSYSAGGFLYFSAYSVVLHQAKTLLILPSTAVMENITTFVSLDYKSLATFYNLFQKTIPNFMIHCLHL